MKKIISSILAVTLLFSLCVPTYATSEFVTATYATSEFVTAQVAFISDVDETGSNIGNDSTPNNSTINEEIPVKISVSKDHNMLISTSIAGEPITLSATPVARSANNHAIYFDSEINNENFKVVHLGYVDNAEANMYFKDYCASISANQILQIYLRDLSSSSRNYILLEIFDYQLTDSAYLIDTLPQDTAMGSWVAYEFIPAHSDFYDISSATSTSNIQRTYTVTYYFFTYEQTHTITLAADCTYTDFRVGQNTDIIYRLEIVGKTMVCPKDPTQNSNTESHLHVDALSLRQTAIPNAAFISESIDGIVQDNDHVFGSSLSGSIGISYGPIGVSASLPNVFTYLTPIDINDTYTGFVNGRNGEYTKSIKTTMDSSFKLTQIGYYFEVRCTMGDFLKKTSAARYHLGTWDITIINAGEHTTKDYIIPQNVPIKVT